MHSHVVVTKGASAITFYRVIVLKLKLASFEREAQQIPSLINQLLSIYFTSNSTLDSKNPKHFLQPALKTRTKFSWCLFHISDIFVTSLLDNLKSAHVLVICFILIQNRTKFTK